MSTFVGAPSKRRSRTRNKPVVVGNTPPSIPVRAIKGVVLTLACAVIIVPFLAVVSTSLADQQQITTAGGFVLWPTHPSFYAYRAILGGGVVTRGLLVSIGITVVGTLLSLAASVLLAYGLSRPGSLGHKPVLMMVLFATLFGPGMIPSYLMVKYMGLINSWWSLIIPTLVNAFYVLVLRSFMMELPQETLDAVRIDGAGDLRVLLSIILSLSKAALAVIGLFYAVGYWNAFFNAVLYINDTTKWPLQLVLRTYVIGNADIPTSDLDTAAALPPPQSLQMAILVIAIIPILIVYPVLQRHFAKGVLVGAVKG